MGAKYIYRLDDITPTMNWEQFWKYINLFKEYNVKPLLGIVPDNQDPNLIIDQAENEFWKTIKDLIEQGTVEIAQHGYQHKLFNASVNDCLGLKNDITHLTEFAGLPYKEQYERVKEGQTILRQNGIYTDIWMAPCHSLDFITLRVLKDLGFSWVSDGISVYPFLFSDLVFVPQQIGRPRSLPFGVFTICIHPNSDDEEIFNEVEAHLKSEDQIISFGEAVEPSLSVVNNFLNLLFKVGYSAAKAIRSVLRNFL